MVLRVMYVGSSWKRGRIFWSEIVGPMVSLCRGMVDGGFRVWQSFCLFFLIEYVVVRLELRCSLGYYDLHIRSSTTMLLLCL